MKEIMVKFTDGTRQTVVCEDYYIKNGCLYLVRVNKVEGAELGESKIGRVLMIHNMNCVENMTVEWLD